jgi:hypothetical protein
MSDRDKLRRLKHLLYKHYTSLYYFAGWKRVDIETARKAKEAGEQISIHLAEKIEIYDLAEELNIPDNELCKMWLQIRKVRYENERNKYGHPQSEGRDNKGVYVGSGGGNKNKVRYPSKKRSKATWAKFYAMFPYYAEKDNWDGKTSDRMKK